MKYKMMGNLYFRILLMIVELTITFQWCLKATVGQLAAQINQVDWSPNSLYIAVASNSKRVTVFSVATLDVVWFESFPNNVTSAKFSKNGKMLGVTQVNTDTVRIYNVPTFTLNSSFRANHSSATTTIFQIDFNYNDSRIVTCGSDGNVNQILLSTPTREWQRTLTPNQDVLSCEYSLTGKVGASSRDGKMYSLRATGAIDRQANINQCKDIQLRPNDQRFLYCGCTCNTNLYQFDSQNAGASNFISYYTGIDEIWALSFARDSTFLATGSKNGHLIILDTTNRASPFIDAYFKQPVSINSLRVSDDNNKIAVSRVDGFINIYKRLCTNCPVGFYSNITCRMCNYDLLGCYTCKNSTMCFSCYQGYYLNSLNTCTICRNTLQGCIHCYSSTACKNCALTYYLNSNLTCSKCSSLIPQCQQCFNNGTCILCSYISYLMPNKTCSLCNVTIKNCIACYLQYNSSSSTKSTLYCRQCVYGYYANQGQCLSCTANCLTCISTGSCIACFQEYKLSGTTCVKCDTYCQVCLYNGTCLQCIPTTILNTATNTCSVCVFPCVTCSVSTNNCTTCALGYYLPTGLNTCSKCIGCPLCNQFTGVCLSCPTGQYLVTPANTCSNCLNVSSHCLICSGTTCISCERNYYLTNTNICQISTTIQNCQIYRKGSTTECQHCSFGLYLDLNTSICLACAKQCAICQDSNTCKQCHIGYYLNTINSTCIKCSNNCITCNSATQCISCSNQFYLSGTTCLLCSNQIPKCNSCLNSTNCLNCFLGYRLATDSLSCIECLSPCTTCNNTGCLSCQNGYFYSSNSCTRCPQMCSSCLSGSFCLSCVVGYLLNGSSTCVACDAVYPNCLTCSSTNCTYCKQNYLLNSALNVCYQCESNITNCLICSNGQCLRCNPSFYPSVSKTQCISCSLAMSFCQRCSNQTICQQCMLGFYLNSNFKCTKCMIGCYSCSDSTTCNKCDSGFLLNSSSACTSCNALYFGCYLCSVSSDCYSCKVGFYMVSSTSCVICKNDLQGCIACNSSTYCQSCDSGYFLNSSNKCQLCSSTIGCSLCNETSGACKECTYGYFLNSTTTPVCELCSSIHPNCLLCDMADCNACQSGTYLQLGNCLYCSNLFNSCNLCNPQQCIQCQEGFYLTLLNNCQKCTIRGCQICSQTGLQCVSCENLYYKVGTLCQTCDTASFGCLSCVNSTVCIICKTGYYLHSNGTCIICNSLFEGCRACSNSKCETCDSNYFNNVSAINNSCISCKVFFPGCSLCYNQSQCILCQSGYYLQNLQCHSCTGLNSCLICSDSSNCLLCNNGYYLSNSQCSLCSDVIVGCFSCVSSTLCLSCSGSFQLSSGLCVEMKGTSPKQYKEIKFVTQYINSSHFSHILYAVGYQFKRIDQNWTSTTKIQYLTPPNNKDSLNILYVQWGSQPNSIKFYTNNPIGQIARDSGINKMPFFITNFGKKRLLFSIQQLNVKISFQMTTQCINQIFPQLDTSKQNLALSFKLDRPEFFRTIIKNQTHYFYIFGIVVLLVISMAYLIKICFVIPNTKDAGQIIPHLLLVKSCAMVIYPSYGSYINYCLGFTYIDFPWLNQYFSSRFSNLADESPASFKMFYNNLNISSTYLLAFLVFLIIYVPLSVFIFCKNNRKSQVKNQLNAQQDQKDKLKWLSTLTNLQSFTYCLFVGGLTFHSFSNIIGVFYNPTSVIKVPGGFYILGILIYATLLVNALGQILNDHYKIAKIRIVIKSTLMCCIFINPIALLAKMAIIDTVLMIFQYKCKTKQWVVPKIWLVNQIFCIGAYSSLILFSNTVLGIIICSILIVSVVFMDILLIYYEHLQYQRIKAIRQNPKNYHPQLYQKSLSIEGFVPKQEQIINHKQKLVDQFNPTQITFTLTEEKAQQSKTLNKQKYWHVQKGQTSRYQNLGTLTQLKQVIQQQESDLTNIVAQPIGRKTKFSQQNHNQLNRTKDSKHSNNIPSKQKESKSKKYKIKNPDKYSFVLKDLQ